MNLKSIPARRWIYAALALLLAGQACTISLFDPPNNPATTTPPPAAATITPYPAAQTTFVVTIPEPLHPGESIVLTVMDEVTGLALNATKYPLSARDATTYSGAIPVPVNSVLKYRYARMVGNSIIPEKISYGDPVSYLLHNAVSSAEVQDVVAVWSDRSTTRPTSSILGQGFNMQNGKSVAVVTCRSPWRTWRLFTLRTNVEAADQWFDRSWAWSAIRRIEARSSKRGREKLFAELKAGLINPELLKPYAEIGTIVGMNEGKRMK